MRVFKPLAVAIVAASAIAGIARADIIKPYQMEQEGHDNTACKVSKVKPCKPDMPRDGGPKEPNRAGA